MVPHQNHTSVARGAGNAHPVLAGPARVLGQPKLPKPTPRRSKSAPRKPPEAFLALRWPPEYLGIRPACWTGGRQVSGSIPSRRRSGWFFSDGDVLDDITGDLFVPAVVEAGSAGVAWPASSYTSSSATPWVSRSVMTATRNECGERSGGREAERDEVSGPRSASAARQPYTPHPLSAEGPLDISGSLPYIWMIGEKIICYVSRTVQQP